MLIERIIKMPEILAKVRVKKVRDKYVITNEAVGSVVWQRETDDTNDSARIYLEELQRAVAAMKDTLKDGVKYDA